MGLLMRIMFLVALCSVMLTACGNVPSGAQRGAAWDNMNYGNYANITGELAYISPGMK
jgi:hypothetical protein